MATELGKELQHAVEVGEAGAVAVDKFTESVLTIDKIFGILDGISGNAAQKFRVHSC